MIVINWHRYLCKFIVGFRSHALEKLKKYKFLESAALEEQEEPPKRKRPAKGEGNKESKPRKKKK